MKKKKVITELEVKHIIKKYRIRIENESYKIRENGLIDVKGSVAICDTRIFKLPLKFGTVTGDFICKSNSLKTLKGSPCFIGGNFDCSDNNLSSLVGGPAYVGGSYFCQDNSLICLKGSPFEVTGRFNCALNQLESLEYGPKRVGKSYYAHHNNLKTLSGSAVFVGGTFNIAANLLTNLEGCPDYIIENFHFDCWLPSLYMGTKNCHVGRVKIESLERIDNGNSILPEVILSSQKQLPILFKYNKYLNSIWSVDRLNDEEELLNFLLDVKQGLR